jgi:hypothetical protein
MKKIILIITAFCLFIGVLTFNFYQKDNVSDISLSRIGVTAQANAEEIEPINYDPTYYSGTESWCCFRGSKGCIPVNCP